jgi:ADP-heptose:LPS heptosyltransferase
MILFAPFARKLRNGNRSPKDYPPEFSRKLVELLQKQGNEVVQIGVKGEEQIAPKFETDLSLEEVTNLLKISDTFIAVDSFLQHHAWDIGKRGTVIFSQSDPNIFGHEFHNNLLKDRKYLRPNQFDLWESTPRNDEAFFDWNEVFERMK